MAIWRQADDYLCCYGRVYIDECLWTLNEGEATSTSLLVVSVVFFQDDPRLCFHYYISQLLVFFSGGCDDV